MRILVTGSQGFIGKNLIAELDYLGHSDVYKYDRGTSKNDLDGFTRNCNFVFHLAGINRPRNEKEFMEGNFGFTSTLLKHLKKHRNTCPIVFASSIQAKLENPYGRSKKAGEDLLFSYGEEMGAKVLVYRFPNVFGKWCKPNYNSVIATFCHNIAHGLPIEVHNPDAQLNLVYIDDVITELINALKGRENRNGDFCEVRPIHTTKLGNITDLIYSFKDSRRTLAVPDLADGFTKKLYSTYLSYLPKDQFGYALKMNVDNRGSFTEFLRTPDRGQVSVNISRPGITKGNHWHHTKNEKFLVVQGRGVIRFRRFDSDEVLEYFVSGDKLEVVDIPTGYTHNIENIGETDLITIMWANEPFDPDKPDTYFLEV